MFLGLSVVSLSYLFSKLKYTGVFYDLFMSWSFLLQVSDCLPGLSHNLVYA